MPTEGTERQGFRYPRDKWQKFGQTAQANGSNASQVLQDFINWYIGEPKSKAPKRPPPARSAQPADQ